MTKIVDKAPAKPTLEAGQLKAMITKMGHLKVHKGERDPETGEEGFFRWKDEVSLPADVARGLEKRGFAEVDEPLE